MDIVQVFQEFGFSVACVIVCGWFIYKMYNDMQKNSQVREDKLYKEIHECRVINKQALETIANYAEKLDDIKIDVKIIKSKLDDK